MLINHGSKKMPQEKFNNILNKTKNRAYQNMWDIMRPVLRYKLIALNT